MANFRYTIAALESEDKDSQPKHVQLALQESDDVEGGVDLVTLDEDGDIELYVLTINPTGTFFRHASGNFGDDDGEGNPNSLLVLDE